jgi:hypothetical protein
MEHSDEELYRLKALSAGMVRAYRAASTPEGRAVCWDAFVELLGKARAQLETTKGISRVEAMERYTAFVRAALEAGGARATELTRLERLARFRVAREFAGAAAATAVIAIPRPRDLRRPPADGVVSSAAPVPN